VNKKRNAAKTAITFILLANLFVAQAISPILLAAPAAGVAAIAYEPFRDWIFAQLGYVPAEEKDYWMEKAQAYRNYTSSNLIANDVKFKTELEQDQSQYIANMYETLDWMNESLDYAWYLVKDTAIKAKAQNKTLDEAYTLVVDRIQEYYNNKTKIAVAKHNSLLYSVAVALDSWNRDYGLGSAFKSNTSNYILFEESANRYVKFYYSTYYNNWHGDFVASGGGSTYTESKIFNVTGHLITTTVSVAGNNYNVTRLKYTDSSKTVTVNKIKIPSLSGQQIVVYDYSLFNTILNKIDAHYNQISANAYAYVQAIYQNNLSVTQLVDSQVLSHWLVNQGQQTGYYGYFAGQFALMGLPTNLNSTWEIRLDDGTLLKGYLFTNWNTTFTSGQRYTIPNGYYAFFLDESGNLYKLPAGANFTVTGLYDARTGETVGNVTVKEYVSHTDDVTKLYAHIDELSKMLLELQDRIYAMTPPATAGGASGDWQAWFEQNKLYLAGFGLAALAVYAFASRKN